MSKRGFLTFPIRLVVKRGLVFLLTMSFILSWSVPGARAVDMREIEGQLIFVNINATGANNGTSWTDAYLSLQDALSASISGDQIWVAAGTYTPGPEGSPRTVTFQLVAGVVVYGGFAGNETSLDQRNWNTNVTILSGDLNDDDSGFTNNDENSYHVVTGTVGDDAAILDGVTILGGNANGGDLNDCGGGMLNFSGGDLTLANIAFSGNTAETGGGMYNYMSSPILINVTFDGNAANGGGGIYNLESNPTLNRIAFNSNTAQNGGGGIYNYESCPTLNNVIFSGNTARKGGGGMRNFISSPTLNNVTFSGNEGNYGSGIFNQNSSPNLTGVSFISNSASTWGGGLYNYASSSPTLTNVAFSNNTAQNGGGMENSELSNPTLINVTFSGNTAEAGGGMENDYNSSPTVSNSIFWADNGGEIDNENGSTATVSFSDVQGGYPGTSNIDIDPLLAPLGNYGGGVQTIALLPGSPVIDATSSNCPATDARGLTRSSPDCDLGAFESQGFTLTKIEGDNQSTLIHTAFVQPLCVLVTANNDDEPVDSGKITFTSPSEGASATLTANPAIVADGVACASAVANGIGGSYNVTANAAGAAEVMFSLSNSTLISLYPSEKLITGRLGETIQFVETLRNQTGNTDTIILTLGDSAWPTVLSTDTIGPLSDGEEVTFTVTVTIPLDAEWYSSSSVVLTATSSINPSTFTDTALLTAQAYAPPQVSVSPDNLINDLMVGEQDIQEMSISNGIGVTLTYQINGINSSDLGITLFTDWLSVVPISGTILTGESKNIDVTFDASHLEPDVYTTTLLISSNDPVNSVVEVPVTLTVTDLIKIYLPCVILSPQQEVK